MVIYKINDFEMRVKMPTCIWNMCHYVASLVMNCLSFYDVKHSVLHYTCEKVLYTRWI